MEYRFQPRFQYFLDYHLSHPISYGRYTQRTELAVTLGNKNLPHRLGVITPRTHPIPQRIEITAQAGLKILDAFLINTRRTLVGCHAFPGLPNQPFGYLEGFGLCQRILPFHGCHTSKDRIRSCLCSTAITAPSSLLCMTPPLCFASVLWLSRVHRLSVSLGIEATASQVPHQRLLLRSRHLYAGCRQTGIQVSV